ncbi:hypothetical protein MMC10_005650 [Thelotrema lepadinum]|nr:hypothetical protein [Thelotrema lepadinum]
MTVLLYLHKELKKAYAGVYSNIEAANLQSPQGTLVKLDDKYKWFAKYVAAKADAAKPEGAKPDALQKLAEVQGAWNEQSLSRNTTTVRDDIAKTKQTATGWLNKRIEQLNTEIEDLKTRLGIAKGAEAKMLSLPVVDEKGVVIAKDDLEVKPGKYKLVGKKPAGADGDDNESSADPWTRISCKASTKMDVKETSTSQSASAIAFKAGWGLWKVSGGASHTQSSAKAMQSMSNLDVDITMDCMVVEIERPWLHAELFADAELDSGKFDISPGEAKLKEMYEKEEAPVGYYQQFSSYPTAFVVAADVELGVSLLPYLREHLSDIPLTINIKFSGDTTQLESAVSASSTSANLSVGYGPFALSGSHSQSKSSNKTKMQSTATGCKISIQAPQIVVWV